MNEPAWLTAFRSWSETWLEPTGVPAGVALFALVLALGFVVAVVARRVARGLTAAAARLIARIGEASDPPDVEHVGRAVGAAAYWLVLVATLLFATETLGPPVVTAWLSNVVGYLPRIMAAIAVAALGTIVARVARRVIVGTARSANLPAAERVGRAAELALMIGVGLVAIEQLGIEVSLLATVILVAFSALLGGAALAFGLGSRDWVANVLSAHYVERLYRTGQTIRVRDIEGRIVRITETAVILENDEGEVALPAREFASNPSTLVLRKAKP
jgi:small-conductance mechanosensitive channel